MCVKAAPASADHANSMACHQHRCCSRSGTATATGATAPDYVLLTADDAGALNAALTLLRGCGALAERHDLGLRIDCQGEHWQSALAHLCDTLSHPARRALRVARISNADDQRTFHRALLATRPLDAFVRALVAPVGATPTAADTHLLGDVFKGESLE